MCGPSFRPCSCIHARFVASDGQEQSGAGRLALMAPSGWGWSTHKLALTLVAVLAAAVLLVVLLPGAAKDDVYLRQPRTPHEHQAGDQQLDAHGSSPGGQPSVTSLPERVPTEVTPTQAECLPCTTPPPVTADADAPVVGLTPGELEYDFQADVAHSAGTVVNVVFVAASSQQHFWMFMVYDLLQAATPYMIRCVRLVMVLLGCWVSRVVMVDCAWAHAACTTWECRRPRRNGLCVYQTPCLSSLTPLCLNDGMSTSS